VEELGPYHAGQEIHYRVRVQNAGAATSSTVEVTDRLAAGTSALAVEASPGVTCNPQVQRDIVCRRTGLGHEGEFFIRLKVRLPDRLPGNGIIENQATVDPRNLIAESSESNNKHYQQIAVGPADTPTPRGGGAE
jgi:uncharacterized repeat protein (TIGR01451 family)